MRRFLARSHSVLGFAAAIWLVLGSSAFAKSPIEITAHSQTQFAIYKGDQLSLTVQASGESLEYKWIRSQETFCRTAECSVDTGDWGLGTHRVVVVVLNAKASLFLKYNIRILQAPAGYKPGKVVPPLVEAGEGMEQISADDYTVRMLHGRGYSYHKRKVQVVGPLPRAVEWTERLKTKSGAQMRLSREGAESHILAAGTSVQLAQAGSGRRALQLKAGTLRSRNLSGKDPRWSVVVGGWLQVDTDASGDVLVTKVDPEETETAKEDDAGEDDESTPAKSSGEQVRIVVLRGAARVYRAKDGATSGDAVVLPQGVEWTVTKGDFAPAKLVQPDAKRVALLFSETTPEYLLGKSPKKADKGLTILQNKVIKTLANALDVARSANGQHDYLVTVEAFAPFLSDMKGNYEANYLLGEAYRGLYLYDSATPAYQAAEHADKEAAEPYFTMGLIELNRKKWNEAITQFEAAADRDYANEQALNYYLGVAKYNAENPVGAKSSFTYSLWDPKDPAIADSAQKFYDRVKTDGWLDLRFGAGVFYDSNVLRAGDALDLETIADGKIKNKKSSGYLGNAGFTLWAARQESFHFYFSFDAEKSGYLEKSLADLAFLDQKLGMGTGLAFGGDPGEKKWFALDLDGYARTIALGEERSLDALGGSVKLGSPRLMNLSLRTEALLALDPLPARDDVLDPVRWEVVSAGERSVHLSYYGLGLKPIDGRVFHLGLDLKSGGGNYRSDLHQDENFKDTQLRLDLALTTSLRNEVDFGIQQLKRTFANSEDGRKDSNLALDLGWKWYYTTALYHRLSFGNESQTSSRDVNTYKRQTFMYKLNLDF